MGKYFMNYTIIIIIIIVENIILKKHMSTVFTEVNGKKWINNIIIDKKKKVEKYLYSCDLSLA